MNSQVSLLTQINFVCRVKNQLRIEQQLIFLPFHNDYMHKQFFNALKQNSMLTLKIAAENFNCSTKFNTLMDDCKVVPCVSSQNNVGITFTKVQSLSLIHSVLAVVIDKKRFTERKYLHTSSSSIET